MFNEWKVITTETSTFIEMNNVSKSFPGVRALSDVSISFSSKEVHVLLGENGAGKSTLIKILSGVYKKDSGSITINGKAVEFANAREAIDYGVSVIHQELSLIPDLTVAENIFLGREPITKGTGLIDKRKMNKMAGEILNSIGIKVNPKRIIRYLNTADKQMVEIARAVSRNAFLVIMDEPTSSLSSKEVNTLFSIIRRLKEENVAIVYITHRMNEIKEIGDRVTILRDGRNIKTLLVAESNEDQWISLMVGREVTGYFNKVERHAGDVVLEVKNLTREPFYRNISFDLKKGEIVGIAGLVGAGRTELVRGIFGADKYDSGEIYLYGKKVKFNSPKDAIKRNIGLVPEERRLQGLLLEESVKHNISLPSLSAWANNGFVNRRREKQAAAEYIEKLKVRTPSENAITKNLSGGNQQKVIIAKWLAAQSKILILDEPTRGIDVNAKAEIYSLMGKFIQDGGSIIMVSSELPEILGVSDRVFVMREGILAGILSRDEASEESIMQLASIRKSSGRGI